MVVVPQWLRPGAPRSLGNHEARIRALERHAASRRTLRGIVGADGSIVDAGTGDWTVTKDLFTSGVYTITFAPSFGAMPDVTATVTNDDTLGDGPFIATLDPTRDASSVTVRVWAVDTAPYPFDGQFDFVAVGP